MKHLKISSLVASAVITAACLAAFFLSPTTASAYTSPKQEFRASWVATVYEIDWPVSSQRRPNLQKMQLRRMLDSLQNNNFNAVCFQVRSMSDACYNSSYEPWSSSVTGTRGQAPTYDPFAYLVEQCHLRGMECHAWVNPYRYGVFTGNAIKSRETHQDTIMQNSGMLLNWYNSSTNQLNSILDPGQQQTIDWIVNVCKELVTNYDIDGLLFDDYFYPSGIPSNSSAPDYTEWKAANSGMNFGDWRRDNVNRMVQAVYSMIQDTKPYVRFGIGPAGAAASNATVAAKYGVTPCPSSDWQYTGIFSDPLAWLNAKTLDYISPQIYWTFGHSTNDYGKLCTWWSQVANKFERHLFVSHSISSLTAQSTGNVTSDDNDATPVQKASGPNNTSYDEFVNQVEANRSGTLNNAPGSIFYSTRFLYRIKSSASDAVDKNIEFSTFLGLTSYSLPALPPAMPWKTATDPGTVSGISATGDTLSWNALPNMRYTVYAIPTGDATSSFSKDVTQLLGFSYDNAYAIPAAYTTGYKFAVCAYDRYGNEWAPAFYDNSAVSTVSADRNAIIVSGSSIKVAAIGAKKVTVQAYDTNGKLQAQLYKGKGGNLTVSLDNLSSGVHVITVTTDGNTRSVKFVN